MVVAEHTSPSASNLRERVSSDLLLSPFLPLSPLPGPCSCNKTVLCSLCKDELINTHAYPIHVHIQPSLLAQESPIQNYNGLVNLAILMLVVSTSVSALENFRTYGLLFIAIPGHSVPISDFGYLAFFGLFYSPIAILVAYSLELVPKFTLLKAANICLLFALSAFLTWEKVEHVIPGMLLLCSSIILVMKLISFHLVLMDLKSIGAMRAARGNPANGVALTSSKELVDGSSGALDVPSSSTEENPQVSILHMFYFWAAPTLCFQLQYPRSEAFRWRYFMTRLFELFSCITMIYILIEQYAVPTVVNSTDYLVQLDFILIIERLLLLSVSNICIWLLFFYAFFHSFLNCISEVIGFGDRVFYLPWWNSCSIDEYWRLWNQPVHMWMKRHIYLPLRRRGISPSISVLAIFGLSGLLHEIAIGIPTHVLQFWAFLVFLLQVPLIYTVKYILMKKPEWRAFGNFFFWVSFCVVGQPMFEMNMGGLDQTKALIKQFRERTAAESVDHMISNNDERPTTYAAIQKVTSLRAAEHWRNILLREVSRSITRIQSRNVGSDHQIKTLNDSINNLVREKNHWDNRIRQLGGKVTDRRSNLTSVSTLPGVLIDNTGKPIPVSGPSSSAAFHYKYAFLSDYRIDIMDELRSCQACLTD
ncbi:O-acyltransferase [Mitosporidium daphniae]|uniref:diacylglycerol O-acyltransferase n=1 Tax=Mitosporidium daphniae TaxID=1485682 RepID=A0A098VRK4_9MICR|nr:O-acyltransferase [Mitosporidium daphniae]KGG51600.1 O-acyltransferase [Mitosporidium daphniae]|eukprot:XP_013238027.1 O-acyltransferase [Mitosporidium daphniae]